MRRAGRWAALLLAGAAATGCGTGCGTGAAESAGHLAAVDPRGWQAEDTLRILLENGDTTRLWDIDLFAAWESRLAALRCDTIGVTLIVETPDSLRFTEPVRLQDDGDGDPQEWHTPYRSGVRLRRTGNYTFSFVRCGGEQPVGLRAIGMEITPTEEDGKR